MHVAKDGEYQSLIQKVQHLPLEPNICTIAMFKEIFCDSNAIWQKTRHKTAN